MISCILIDDEIKALKMLQKKIEKKFPQLKIAETFQDPEKAIVAIRKLKPQLVFLDIAMPNMSGFDVLSQFNNPEFEVIFITAYDNYAIQAIRHAAIGYIVKPIDDEALADAIKKAEKNIKLKTAKENNKKLLNLLTEKSNTISIPTQDGFIFIKKDKLVRLEGVEGYTKIITSDSQEYLSSYNLGKFLEILNDDMNFFQPHRSHLVNLKYITRFLNEGYLELVDHSKVPLARSKRKEFLELISKF